jgi:hypothetical protein
LDDFANAMNRSATIDTSITSAASSISSDYADLVSLSLKLTIGALDITVGEKQDRSLDPTDVKVFMKDMGFSRYELSHPPYRLNIHVSRTNPVEVIYAAFPSFLYVQANYLMYLLDALLQFQASSATSNNFAIPDLGELLSACSVSLN